MAEVRKKAPKKKAPKKKEPAEDAFGDVASPEVPEADLDRYIDAAGSIDGWGPAAEVLDTVTSVRTVFPDFNRAVRVGGLPVRRIHTVHGPTHGGKTAFVLGLVKSFADRGYLAGYVDAEHALGREFAAELVADLERRRNFLAVRPDSYEQTIARVDAFLSKAARVREKIPDAKSILVIDSINKLVPERELEKLLKQGEINEKGAKELAKGHHGRYRAALNQAWLDQLTPKIARAECALVIIAQEREEDDPRSWFADNFKVKGGQALLFDASLVIRVSKASPIFLPGAEKKNDSICGFAHRVRIWKSKVGHMDGRHSDCVFHLSNGRLTPPGLDTPRDAMVVGSALGIVKQSGSWYSYKGRRNQGEPKTIQWLHANPGRLGELLDEIGAAQDVAAGRVAE